MSPPNTPLSVHIKYWYTRGVLEQVPSTVEMAKFKPGEFLRLAWPNLRSEPDSADALKPLAIAYHPASRTHVYVDYQDQQIVCAFGVLGSSIESRSFTGRSFIWICEFDGNVYALDRKQSQIVKIHYATSSLTNASVTEVPFKRVPLNVNTRFVAWEVGERLHAMFWNPENGSIHWGSGRRDLECEPFDLGLPKQHTKDLNLSHAVLHGDRLFLSDHGGRRILEKPLLKSKPPRIIMSSSERLLPGGERRLSRPTGLAAFRFWDEEFKTNIAREFPKRELISRIHANEFLVCLDADHQLAFTANLAGQQRLPLLGFQPDTTQPTNLLNTPARQLSNVVLGPDGTLLFGTPGSDWYLLHPHIGKLLQEPFLEGGRVRVSRHRNQS
jgi:hypothetical protein